MTGGGNVANSDTDRLHALRTRLEAAENEGDATAIAAVMAEDVVIMVPNEPVQEGRHACAAFVRRMLEETLSHFTRHIVYTSAEVRIIGDVAFDRGTFAFHVQPRSGGEQGHATGKYLWLYSRVRPDSWKLARLIVSLDDDEEEEAHGEAC